jgi:hypothetical protein
MAVLWGKTFTKSELLQLVGDIAQIADVRKSVLADGHATGVEVLDFTTGSGFGFTTAAGRSLDITTASYNGMPLSWRSSVGHIASQYYDQESAEWLRTYYGGLVATCGISYAGADCVDGDQELGVHGRIGAVPAERLSFGGEWEGDEYVMWVSGRMREGGLFQDELQLDRKITTKLGSNSFTIHDKVTNIGWQTSPLMILYHCNFGYPVVAPGAEVVTPSATITPRDAAAEQDKETWYQMHEPTKDYAEKVYYHDAMTDANGDTLIGIVNRGMGIGGYIRYNRGQLGNLIQWKQMGQGWYTCGLEPANCLVEGRAMHRAEGTLEFIDPQEEREFTLEIGVLPDSGAITAFDAEVKALKG